MPIGVQELDAAAMPLADRILAVLAAAPDQAFNLYEVIQRVEGLTDQAMLVAVFIEAAMDSRPLITKYTQTVAELARSGKVKQAELHGTTYYAAVRA